MRHKHQWEPMTTGKDHKPDSWFCVCGETSGRTMFVPALDWHIVAFAAMAVCFLGFVILKLSM